MSETPIDAESIFASDNNTGIIVMHGIGIHPNWGQVVRPIRVGLAETGLHTLSIQMPTLHKMALVSEYSDLLPEAASRIELAIEHLKKQGINKVVLIAHSLGTQMASYYLSRMPDKVDSAVVGFVGVSMLDSTVEYLKKVDLPILDVFGSNDNLLVLKSVSERKKASVNNKYYRQIIVNGANHFFDDKEADMLEQIKLFITSI